MAYAFTMPATLPKLTAHGPEADRHVMQQALRSCESIARYQALPLETIGAYLVGCYAAAEGWVVKDASSWCPFEELTVLLIIPDDFTEDLPEHRDRLQRALPVVSAETKAPIMFTVHTVGELNRNESPVGLSVRQSRLRLWSRSPGYDPLETLEPIAVEFYPLIGRQLFRESATGYAADGQLWRLREHAWAGVFAQRAFIQSVRAIARVAESVLIRHGLVGLSSAQRLKALEALVPDRVPETLVLLYAIVEKIRRSPSRPAIPAWEDLSALREDILAVISQVAQTSFGATAVPRP